MWIINRVKYQDGWGAVYQVGYFSPAGFVFYYEHEHPWEAEQQVHYLNGGECAQYETERQARHIDRVKRGYEIVYNNDPADPCECLECCKVFLVGPMSISAKGTGALLCEDCARLLAPDLLIGLLIEARHLSE